MHISTFTPSTSSRTSPCRWTCDRHSTEGNTAPHREVEIHIPFGWQHNASEVRPAIGCWYTSLLSVLSCPPWEGNVVRCVLTDDTKLAVQHRPRREDERRVDEGIGHQNDELLRHKPAHVAHRQPEAVPEEPEEQRTNVLQAVSEPNLRWSNACLNFHHLDSQSAGYLERVRATTTVHPRLFEISITLTFRARYVKRVIDTATVYSHWFQFLTTLTFRALHGHLATFIESWWTFTHACLRFHHFDILSTAQTQTCSRFLQTFALPDIKLFNSSSLERHCGGNQLLGGSVCLSPLSPSISKDLHDSIAAAPGFTLTLRFSGLVHHLSGPNKRKIHTFHIHIHKHKRMRSHTTIC